MSYYFAYGSNMDAQQMSKRCPDSKLLGKAVLRDYKLDFTIFSDSRKCGCADIIKSVGDNVWGLVFLVTNKEKDLLDKFEGHPKHYQRINLSVIGEQGDQYDVFSYEVVNKSGKTLDTSNHYLGLIKNAAEVNNFPKHYQKYLNSFKLID